MHGETMKFLTFCFSLNFSINSINRIGLMSPLFNYVTLTIIWCRRQNPRNVVNTIYTQGSTTGARFTCTQPQLTVIQAGTV